MKKRNIITEKYKKANAALIKNEADLVKAETKEDLLKVYDNVEKIKAEWEKDNPVYQ